MNQALCQLIIAKLNPLKRNLVAHKNDSITHYNIHPASSTLTLSCLVHRFSLWAL